MKKIFSIFCIVLSLVLCLTNVQATEAKDQTIINEKIVNFGMFEGDYTSSIQKYKRVLPFINLATKNLTYDTDIISSGISFGSGDVSVEKKLSGIQVLTATDTVEIDGSVEYGFIIGTNVIIKGKIEKDVTIFAKSVFITETAEIGNDAIVVSSKLEVRGKVNGSLLGMADDVYLSGKIANGFRMTAKNVKFENEEIKGDIYLATDTDREGILKKYPNAEIEKYTNEEENLNETKKLDIYSLVIKGIVSVLTYTLIVYLLNRKENKYIKNMTEKFKTYTPFALCMGVVLLACIPLLVFVLIILGIYGLGIIAWPILVIYAAFIILCLILNILITGLLVIDLIISNIKKKLTKLQKILIYLGVFVILYVLSYFISTANMLFNIIAIGSVFTYMTRKLKKQEKEDTKNEEIEKK